MMKPSGHRRTLPRFLLFLLTLGIVVGGLFLWRMMWVPLRGVSEGAPHVRNPLLVTQQASTGVNRSLEEIDSDFTGLVERAIPSVVIITTTAVPDREALVRQFFGLGGGVAEASKMGSGMIVSPEGHIVTNWHVVKDASDVSVQLSDGRTFHALVEGADLRSDIAVLKVEAEGLHPISFGDSEQVRVGQMVFAVGNPFGLQETVTQGIISAKNRRTVSEAANEFFQTSTIIHPGNSGGPLIDIHGKVIGINNSIMSRAPGSEGISFAIPSNVARRVYEDIINHGRVIYPWFGVIMRPLTPSLAQQLSLPDTRGALVDATLAHSPAERSGLQTGDVILSFNGRPILDWKDLKNRVAEAQVGTPASFSVLRNGKPLILKVVMEEAPTN